MEFKDIYEKICEQLSLDAERIADIMADNPLGVDPNDIKDFFVVGSEARGTAKEDSDLDIAIIIDQKFDADTEEPISSIKFTEMFHQQYASEADVPTTDSGRTIDIQFFYPDDEELKQLRGNHEL
jgi:predicted nucleotidyltransferase